MAISGKKQVSLLKNENILLFGGIEVRIAFVVLFQCRRPLIDFDPVVPVGSKDGE